MTTGAGLAVIGGGGVLPGIVLAAHPDAVLIRLQGVDCAARSRQEIPARFEKLGSLFKQMKHRGIDQVCFAGSTQRPVLDPLKFDAAALMAAPRVLAAMKRGDDALLRTIIALFEDRGFQVRGAHELVPDLVALAAPLVGQPDTRQQADAARGLDILNALGPVDVGQACVVADGLCFGIETLQGTDGLLRYVADSRAGHRPSSGGVLVKRAKPGQDLRVDMPAIGPDTVCAAHAAGLDGIALQAGRVLILERERVEARARELGLALWALA